MKITYDNANRLLKIEITEEIDHFMAEKIRNKVDFEIQEYIPRKILMDFEKVSFMDSAGIGMILGRYKTAKMLGSSFCITNVKPSIKKILEMSGILKIIPIVEK